MNKKLSVGVWDRCVRKLFLSLRSELDKLEAGSHEDGGVFACQNGYQQAPLVYLGMSVPTLGIYVSLDSVPGALRNACDISVEPLEQTPADSLSVPPFFSGHWRNLVLAQRLSIRIARNKVLALHTVVGASNLLQTLRILGML